MHPTVRAARVAGLLYLLISLPGAFCLAYVPGKLIVDGDAAATAANILAHETLFRAGIVCEIAFVSIGFLFVVRALYRLLSGVNETQASLMVTLYAFSVPISGLNVLNELAALTLFRGAGFVSVFDKHQRDALAMLFLDLHGAGISLAAIFWGLWLFPFGVLVIRSGFFPRILGVLLILSGIAFAGVSLTSLLFPNYPSVVDKVAMVLELGEVWMMLWLLIRGAKVRPAAAAPA